MCLTISQYRTSRTGTFAVQSCPLGSNMDPEWKQNTELAWYWDPPLSVVVVALGDSYTSSLWTPGKCP